TAVTAPVLVTGIPHPEHTASRAALAAIDDGDPGESLQPAALLADAKAEGLEPGAFVGLAAGHGLTAVCIPADDPAAYRAVLVPGSAPDLNVPMADDGGPLANNPAAGQRHRELAVQLREHVRKRLPDYM